MLEAAPIHFIGNVEGHDLFDEGVDVVVCDGFVGNVMLKSAERLAKAISGWLRSEIQKKPDALRRRHAGAFGLRLGPAPHQRGGIRRPSRCFGVNGICIKAHGNSSPKAIKNAIRVAREAVTQEVNPSIVMAIAKL